MKSLLTAALSCFLSLLLFRFVIATSPPAPAPAADAAPKQQQEPQQATTTPPPPTATTRLPSLLGFLVSPAPRSPLSSLYVATPTLPTRPLSENGCLFKSVALANDCRFAFDAMQSAESGLQLAAALAITRASRQAGATAAQKCSDAADAFYGSGCACEPAVVLGLKFVDIVPRRAKEALLETAKKCPVAGAAALPRGENDASVSLAEGISAARELPGQRSSFASSSSSSG